MLPLDCEHSRTHYESVLDDSVIWPSLHGDSIASFGNDEPLPFFARRGGVYWLGEEPNSSYVSEVIDNVIESVPGYTCPFDSIQVGFLNNAIVMDRQGNIRASLALIYRRVEEMMREPMLEALDEEIASVPAEEMGTDVLLGLLTATLPAKRKLPSRPQLFRSTRQIMKKRGHLEPGVLDGLE
jgi:hypothetical protein